MCKVLKNKNEKTASLGRKNYFPLIQTNFFNLIASRKLKKHLK